MVAVLGNVNGGCTMRTQSPPKHRKVKGDVSLLEKHGYSVEWCPEYSGRWMFGRASALAFVASVHPNSAVGESLRKRGFSADNMGMDWVYYLS